MEDFVPVHGTGVLLLIAVAAVALLLVLIMALRLHAFVALILVSLLTALVAGIPVDEAVPALLDGFGTTLASVALLVGLGAMIGKLLEVTGGAQTLADTLVARFGEHRAPLALGVASLLFGFPIFFDAGFVVFLPLIFSVARRFGGSVLTYALPSAGAFAVMHAFVPPHPGPVGAAGILGADIGLVLVVGLVIGLPTWYVASYLFGVWSGRRFDVPVPDVLAGGEESGSGGARTDVRSETRTAPPRFSTVLLLLLLPLVLILLNTGLNTLATAGVVDGDTTTVGALRLLGQTPVALLITVLVALFVLSRERFTRAEAEGIVNSSLGPVCAIILITGAGGAFGGILRTSGIGDALAESLGAIGLPVIVAAFVIATALRVAQGSATVALTTTAGLIAPVVAAEGLSRIDVALVVIAIAGGSTVLSHVNDSGFWLVGRFLNMDVRTTLQTWTVMETLIGVVGFALAFVASLIL
ncbi:GntP family permease [Pseudonocardia sp. KRD-184]|uniref:GntP family permease n=1 Tax=Pseudonocardia oceani TaxID=2792013 RepID=A0ABS6UK33_9PSEU|nr:GntP family permease [Pseudonocardia oceani]MBW0090755.1 GntP family permease [Pseudonocardia oceani]MBW0098294.1 GntP family permease [Pseudonocardia oceani]MBW0110823.1 GntP family permease [Pseudonocardia oceani]MBW0122529.1 GntP family permease [Pseudonocardia oceani]MBW0132281.1 GntP family permease [Pseudonocardia oceani]